MGVACARETGPAAAGQRGDGFGTAEVVGLSRAVRVTLDSVSAGQRVVVRVVRVSGHCRVNSVFTGGQRLYLFSRTLFRKTLTTLTGPSDLRVYGLTHPDRTLTGALTNPDRLPGG